MSDGQAALQRTYRDTIGLFASGVTVVTSTGPEGRPG